MSTRDELASTIEDVEGRWDDLDAVGKPPGSVMPSFERMLADVLIAEGWRKVPDDLTVERVDRGGDFQSITFSNGSTIYGSSEQDASGNWIDNRAINAILALMDRGQ